MSFFPFYFTEMTHGYKRKTNRSPSVILRRAHEPYKTYHSYRIAAAEFNVDINTVYLKTEYKSKILPLDM